MTDKVELIKDEIHKIMDEEMAMFEEQCRSDNEPNPSCPVVYTRMQMLLQFIENLQSEDVSEDFKQFEESYLEKEKDEIVCVYDRHVGLVDGAQWNQDRFIQKACNWLYDTYYRQGYLDIEDFKKYMEE